MDSKAIRETQDAMERQALKDRKDHRVPTALRVLKAIKAKRVPQVCLSKAIEVN